MAPLPAVTGPVTLETFTLDDLAELAREVAGSMFGYPPVLERRGITLDQYKEIAKNDFYLKMLRQSVLEFQSVKNAQARARLKSAIAFETAIPFLGARIVDKKEPLDKVAQLAKVLADAGGIGGRDQNSGSQDRITISIDLGGDTKLVFDKTAAAAPQGPNALPANAEGESNAPALCNFLEGGVGAMEIQSLSEGTSASAPLQSEPESIDSQAPISSETENT